MMRSQADHIAYQDRVIDRLREELHEATTRLARWEDGAKRTQKHDCSLCEDEGWACKNFGAYGPGRPEIVRCPECSDDAA